MWRSDRSLDFWQGTQHHGHRMNSNNMQHRGKGGEIFEPKKKKKTWEEGNPLLVFNSPRPDFGATKWDQEKSRGEREANRSSLESRARQRIGCINKDLPFPRHTWDGNFGQMNSTRHAVIGSTSTETNEQKTHLSFCVLWVAFHKRRLTSRRVSPPVCLCSLVVRSAHA